MDAAGAFLWLVVPTVVISGFVSVAGIASPGAARIAGLVEWVGLFVAAGLLVLYVAGEDAYLSNGTSRWEAHGIQGFTTLTVIVTVAVAGAVLAAWLLRRSRLAVAGYVGALAAAALIMAAFVGNTAS